jgi:hypothetical protein
MPLLLAVLLAAAQVVFHLGDPRLAEASGLVDLGGAMVSANDSGNDPLLFVLDARTGRTERTIRYAARNTDTEALAPAGPDAVWVGDIGDNLADRAEVVVRRVPLDGGPIASYRLRYPDGPRDAESLFVAGGRLHLVSKEVLGGAFYVAPAQLHADRVNRLRRLAPAPSLATDAAAFPDGRHALVRGYASADLYALPSLRRIGSFGLPPQPQGEGVSIGPGGRIRLASEGAGSAVLQVALPAALARQRTVPAASLSSSPSPAASPSAAPAAAPAAQESAGEDRPSWFAWLGGAGLVLVVAAVAAWGRRRTLR